MHTRVVLVLSLVFVVWSNPPPSGALPNIEYLGCGYDALFGEPVMEAIRFPVVNVTYSSRTVTVSGSSYIIPDNSFTILTPATDASSMVNLYTSLTTVQQEQQSSFTAGFPVHFLPGMFGFSAESTNFNYQQTHRQSFTAQTALRVKSWKSGLTSLNPISQLSSEFTEALHSLPSTFDDSTCPTFSRFIAVYGTHYLSQIQFGGAVSMSTTYQSTHYTSVGAQQVSLDLNTQFELLTFGGSLSNSQQNQLTTLSSTYSSEISLVGGDPADYLPNQWNVWASTVPSNPIPIALDMVVLSDLIPDDYPEQKQALSDAISRYLKQGYPGDIWSMRTSIPTARKEVAASVIGNLLFVAGGESASGTVLASMEAYNPSTDSWLILPAMTYPRDGCASGVIGNSMYVVGGYTGSGASSRLESFDTQTNTWTTRTSVPTPRYYLAAAAVNNFLYAMGGYTGGLFGGPSATVEMYNSATNSWTTKSSMPAVRFGAASAVVDGIIYVIGGYGSGSTIYSSAVAYNPITNSWSEKAHMSIARAYLGVGVVDHTIYAIGGTVADGSHTATVEAYDIRSNSWRSVSSMPSAMAAMGAGAIDNMIFTAGGVKSYAISDTQMYDVAINLPWC